LPLKTEKTAEKSRKNTLFEQECSNTEEGPQGPCDRALRALSVRILNPEY